MSDATAINPGRLRRLEKNWYLGWSFIHWSMAIEGRATGWLEQRHHATVRELMCHALGRYKFVCPAYCLMPDHAHFLWMGTAAESDQCRATHLFRQAWNRELASRGYSLQRQAHDHVLRESEREKGALGRVMNYIFENPIRANLVTEWRSYPFLGALVPGYPMLDVRDGDFIGRFWSIYSYLQNPS